MNLLTKAEVEQLRARIFGISEAKWKEIQKRKQAEYNKAREEIRSGKRINARSRRGGHFVAIDAEGLNIGQPFFRDGRKIQKQRTCLWMAGGAEGFEDQFMSDVNGNISSEDIFKFLLSQPRNFAVKETDGLAPIFISFGFSWDVAQIVADMPYEKRWELHKGIPWERRDDKTCEPNRRRWVLWKDYAISCIPRKSITLCRLTDPEDAFRRRQRSGNDYVSLEVRQNERIEIFDTLGFFQSSFLKAVADFPGVVTPEELKILVEGKADRGGFKGENIEAIKRYTAAELKALVRMMNILRTSLKEAIPDHPIELDNWWGAGAIAGALLKSYLGKNPRRFIGDVREDTEQLRWARHAFFGGRIEMVKQGKHKGELFMYDIASAYPAFPSST